MSNFCKLSEVPSIKAIQELSERLGWKGGIPAENAERVSESLKENLHQDIVDLIQQECIKISDSLHQGQFIQFEDI